MEGLGGSGVVVNVGLVSLGVSKTRGSLLRDEGEGKEGRDEGSGDTSRSTSGLAEPRAVLEEAKHGRGGDGAGNGEDLHTGLKGDPLDILLTLLRSEVLDGIGRNLRLEDTVTAHCSCCCCCLFDLSERLPSLAFELACTCCCCCCCC